MEDPIPYNPPPSNPNPDGDIGMLPIPPLDDDMLAGDFTFPENFAGAGDDDFPLDIDFDFTVDDFSFADDLLLEPQPDPPGSDLSQARSPSSEEDRSPNVVRVYDCSSPLANHEPISSGESNFVEKSSNSGVFSQDSGNNSDRDVSSSSFVNKYSNIKNSSCESGDSERKFKVEDTLGNNNKCLSKRKKEQGQLESSGEGRTSKFRRSSSMVASDSANFNAGSDDDDKRKARLMRNRESAQLSRQRKKQYVEELEDKVRSMHSTITELNSKIMYIMSENATLRQQLSGGVPPPPPPGMYPMPYPWMPCPPYMLKPQGSQVPLVPIPRLKPQPSSSAPKANRKSESRKSEGKTKKVASISLLGLLFFFLLFGGLVPMVNVRYGIVGGGFSDLQKGTVLMVDKHGERIGYGGGMDGKLNHHGRTLQQSNTSDRVGPVGNSSEPLVASLYVPRNDKMVKIDGNLIIHSVLASEKAMASHAAEGVKTAEETSLAIPRNYKAYPIPEPGRSNMRHPHLDGNPSGRQRALGSGSPELKPAGSDGKLQQWFREGHAGPMLSSGMCTEVFQFDVSPLPGAIVPATSIANTTSKQRQNSTRLNKPRNRRILHGEPIPFDTHKLNATKDHGQPHEPSDGLQSNNSHSSMVVSVLVDPREVGDGDGESVIRSKASRIFVVVLVDSVKYVTYSCMLPFVGSGTHLVTA